MLSFVIQFRMFVDTLSGRLSNSFPGSNFTLPPSSPNSHGIISFADPHPLTSIKSYRSKNRGEGAPAIPTCPSTASTPQISAKYALFPVVDSHSLQQLIASPSGTPLILKELHFDGGVSPSFGNDASAAHLRSEPVTNHRPAPIPSGSLPSPPSLVLSFGEKPKSNNL